MSEVIIICRELDILLICRTKTECLENYKFCYYLVWSWIVWFFDAHAGLDVNRSV